MTTVNINGVFYDIPTQLWGRIYNEIKQYKNEPKAYPKQTVTTATAAD